MIARGLWVALMAAIAAVTICVQLDRESRYKPEYASIVPEPARAFALAHLVTSELRSGNRSKAELAAERLVERRPMPAENLRLLSLAQFRAAQSEAARSALQQSARRGWRDRLAQQAMLQFALRSNDQPEAARRFAALFALNDLAPAELAPLARRVFKPGNGEAKAVFAQIVADAERWNGRFLNRGLQVLEPTVFIDVFQRALSAGGRFDCQKMRIAAQRLRRMDEAAGVVFDQPLEACSKASDFD